MTNTIEQFIVYVHRNEAHFTYIYVYHTNDNVFEADSIYILLNLPPNVISHIFFTQRVDPWHDSVDCYSAQIPDPPLPATASNVCATDAWLGGVGQVPPPNNKSWLRRWTRTTS